MRRHGWSGRPVLIESIADARYRYKPSGHGLNWTGTHRLAAARAIVSVNPRFQFCPGAPPGKVPVVFVNGGRPIGRSPLATRTTTDPSRYYALRARRDPASVMMYAELRINAVADAAHVL